MSSNSSNSFIEKIRKVVFQDDNQKHTDENLIVNGNQTDLEALYAHFLYNGSDTNKDYHKNAIKTADLILKVAMTVFVISTIYMFAVIGVLIYNKNLSVTQAQLPVISSAIVEILSATIIWTMKKWLESKNTYFEESIKSEEHSKIIGLIKTMPDGEFKNKMIEKLVDNFCIKHQNRNSKNTAKKNSKST